MAHRDDRALPTTFSLTLALLSCTALVFPGLAQAQTAGAANGTTPLQPISVEAVESDAETVVAQTTTGSTKTDVDILDTPASVSVITEKEIRQRNAQTMQQVLAYTAGVMVDEFGSDDRYDYFRIRGFDELALGTYRDGLPVRGQGWTFARREPYGFERVEVLKGSNSALFGLNAPGGLVNAVTKRPTDYRFGEVYTTLGPDHVEVGTDFGGPLDEAGVWSYRLTAKGQNAAQYYDESNDDRAYLAGALTWRPGSATELTLLTDYNKRDGVPGNGFPVGADLDIEDYLGEPDFNEFDTVERDIGYLFSHDFGGGLSFRQNARYTVLDLDYEQVYGGSEDPAVNREAFAVDSTSEQFAIDSQLAYETSFDGFDSRTLLGVEYTWIEVDETAQYGTAPGIDIYDIEYCGRDCVTVGDYLDWVPEQNTRAVYLQEELTIADRWIATLGGRYDHAEVSIDYPATAITDEADFEAFTGRLGLTWKATDEVSVYGNYSESFEPNVWDLTEDAKEGTQYELGVKYRPADMNALFTAAVFDLTQTNVNTFTSPLVQEQVGEIGVRGLELEGKMEVTDRADVTFAYSYWDAEIREDGIAGNVGNRPSRVPEHMASVWGNYTVPGNGRRGDMSFGFGGRYVGSTFGDDGNLTEVDGYTLVDAAVSYEVSEGVELAVNATNLLDTEYVASSYFGTEYYGDGRTVLATLRYSW